MTEQVATEESDDAPFDLDDLDVSMTLPPSVRRSMNGSERERFRRSC